MRRVIKTIVLFLAIRLEIVQLQRPPVSPMVTMRLRCWLQFSLSLAHNKLEEVSYEYR